MSCNYADNLSPYENKGVCGQPEHYDKPEIVHKKVHRLCELIRGSCHTVVHTGAGISTSAGIPDFRGPSGVWTLEKQGKSRSHSLEWLQATPTYTHRALVALYAHSHVHHIVSQNIDGLHLRSGLARGAISELHGNVFTRRCDTCHTHWVMSQAAGTLGERLTGEACVRTRPCRGRLCDTVLDWEAELPALELARARANSRAAQLSVCLGTSLQIQPSASLPLQADCLVVCNLQPTPLDSRAELVIAARVDDVMRALAAELGVSVAPYEPHNDPVICASRGQHAQWSVKRRAPDSLRRATIEARQRRKSVLIVS